MEATKGAACPVGASRAALLLEIRGHFDIRQLNSHHIAGAEVGHIALKGVFFRAKKFKVMSPGRGNAVEGFHLSFSSAVLSTLADFSVERVGSLLVLNRIRDAV